MRARFDKQLIQLNNQLIEMGTMIEQAIETSVVALVAQDADLAKKIMEQDQEVNHLEKDIENLCMKLLLQQQPVASDLRQISAALKMITDMERIGDQAANIAEMTIEMENEPYIKKLEHIQEMAKETMVMVMKCVEAYVMKDVELAKGVIAHDDIVDKLFNTIKKELVALIQKDAANGEQAANLLLIAKYFERIGDHATNVAEWVIFSITGMHKGEQI